MYEDVPKYISNFLEYMSGIKNRSNSTLREYYYDLRNTFKYLKLIKTGYKDKQITPELLENTDITSLDINFLKKWNCKICINIWIIYQVYKKDYIMETLFKEIIRVQTNKIDEKLIYIDNILKNEGNSDS